MKIEKNRPIISILLVASLLLSLLSAQAQYGHPDHHFEVSNVDLNGQGDYLEIEAGKTIQVSLDYVVWARDGCPGCILQIIVGLEEQPLYCAYHGGPGRYPGKSGSNTHTITAPKESGTYHLMWSSATQYSCEDAKRLYQEYPSSRKKEIATIMVTSRHEEKPDLIIEQKIWPSEAPVATCRDGAGKSHPTTGLNSATWFLYGGAGSWKVFDVTPGAKLKLRARGDECPTCPGCCLGDINFYVYDYFNGQWNEMKFIDGPEHHCGEYIEYYTPIGNRIKIVAESGFYIEVYQQTASIEEPLKLEEYFYHDSTPSNLAKILQFIKVKDTQISGNFEAKFNHPEAVKKAQVELVLTYVLAVDIPPPSFYGVPSFYEEPKTKTEYQTFNLITLTPHHVGDMSHQIPHNILSFADQTLNRTDTFVFSYSPYRE